MYELVWDEPGTFLKKRRVIRSYKGENTPSLCGERRFSFLVQYLH